MVKEFLDTGCQFTMVEDHCVRVAKGEGGGGGAKRQENNLLTAPKWLNISFLDTIY